MMEAAPRECLKGPATPVARVPATPSHEVRENAGTPMPRCVIPRANPGQAMPMRCAHASGERPRLAPAPRGTGRPTATATTLCLAPTKMAGGGSGARPGRGVGANQGVVARAPARQNEQATTRRGEQNNPLRGREAAGTGRRGARTAMTSSRGPPMTERKQWLAKDDAAIAATAAGSCGLGYISFLCIGFNSLVNWIFVMQTLPFIAHTQLDDEDWNNSLLGLFQAVEVLVLLCMLRLGSTSVVGVCTAGLINAVAAVIFPVLTINAFSNRIVKIVSLHVLCLLLGSCSAVLQGSGFALAGVMPRNFVGAVSAGQGLAGAFTFAVVTAASFLWFDIETTRGTRQLVWLVFSIAAVTSLACTGLFYSAMRQTWAVAALRTVAVTTARAKRSGDDEDDDEDDEEDDKDDEDEDEDEEEEEEEDLVDPRRAWAHTSGRSGSGGCGGVLLPAGSSVSTMLTTSAGARENGGVRTRPEERDRDSQKRELLKAYLDSQNGKGPVASATAAAAPAPADEEGDEEEVPGEETEEEEVGAHVVAVKERKVTTVRGWKKCQQMLKIEAPQKEKRQQQAPQQKKQDFDVEQQEVKRPAAGTAGENEQPEGRKRLSRWFVVKQAAPWLFVLMLHMFITFHLYPKVGPLSWHYNRPLVRNHLVVLFGLFCATESVGRFLPDLRSFHWPWGVCNCNNSGRTSSGASTSGRSSGSGDDGDESSSSNSSSSGSSSSSSGADDTEDGCFGWLMLNRRALVGCELARLLLFIPFLLGYALSNVPIINSFYWYCGLIIILALTQGWMGTLAFYYSVTSVGDPEAKKFTGPLSAIASPLGCVIGLYTAAPY